MRIGHNLLAIKANNCLVGSIRKRDKLMEKLSSGYRINRASDDAAGLTISERMRSQIRGLGQASRNAQDGISLIQTAEGALDEVHDMLQRMHKLSVQAANGTNTEDDRNSIQNEINELIKGIDSASANTEFNGIKLLDGTVAEMPAESSSLAVSQSSSMKLQDLLNSNSKNLNLIYMDQTDDFETIKSGTGTATISGYTNLKNVLQTEIVPQAVTGVLRAFSPAFNYLSSSSIGIGLNLYNDATSTTLAAVTVGCASSGGNNVDSTMLTYQLSVNMASLAYDASGNLTNDSRSALETTIVHEMVHGFMDEATTNGMLGITNGVYDTRYTGAQSNYIKSVNSYPTWFKEGMAQTAAGGYANCNDWVNGGLGINTSTSQSTIAAIVENSNNSLTSGTTASKYGTGYLACMYLGYLASGSSNVTAKDISNGLGEILSDLISGKSLETVISERTGGKYSSISDFESKFGDSDSSSFIYKLTQIVGGTGNGGLASGNLTDSDLLPNTPITTPLFALDTQNDTVKNIYPSGVNVLSGGGETTAGTVPVGDYGSTIIGGNTGPIINPGSTIDLSNISPISGVSYDSTRNVLTITNSGDYTLTGLNSNVRVVVSDGVKANITLNNASINTSSGAGISLEGSANVTLNLVGNNSVISSEHGAAGIRVTTGATLTIQGNGALDAESTFDGPMTNAGSGIGGGDGEDGGNIIINGGNINVKSKLNGAGIGGGNNGAGGNITINGGNITVDSGDDGEALGWGGGAAGIGGGCGKDGGTITITGGIVNAISRHQAAGIGGGDSGNGGTITITGGTIAAESNSNAAGIGGGINGSGGTMTITGGTITGKGGIDAAGIGGGCFGSGGNITITGGTITAEGGSGIGNNGGSGIGGGLWKDGGTINIGGTGVIVKATGAGASANIGGGASVGGTVVSGGTVTKTTGIIFEGNSGGVYGDVTLNGPLNCDGKTLTVNGGSTLTVLNGGTITNHGTFTNNGSIENHGVIGSVTGPGITHHYATGITKNIKEPTSATIGKSLASSISLFSPSTITVAYNGTARTLTGTWSVTDMAGNPITDLGTVVKDKDRYIYTVTFASEDGIYFDPSNMSQYAMEGYNADASKYQMVSDEYISKSGPGGGGSNLTYSYVVDSSPTEVLPDPVVPQPSQTGKAGGIQIQIGANANEAMFITIDSIKSEDLGIGSLSVLTQEDAGKSIDACYKAINTVSQIRDNLGAYQNRLEHTISGVSNIEENLQEAESRIRDMDIAKGIMEYSKSQISIQVEQAMLAQANQTTGGVLSLLSI